MFCCLTLRHIAGGAISELSASLRTCSLRVSMHEQWLTSHLAVVRFTCQFALRRDKFECLLLQFAENPGFR